MVLLLSDKDSSCESMLYKRNKVLEDFDILWCLEMLSGTVTVLDIEYIRLRIQNHRYICTKINHDIEATKNKLTLRYEVVNEQIGSRTSRNIAGYA